MPMLLLAAGISAGESPYTIQKISGDLQEAAPYTGFVFPLVVQVNGLDGQPAPRQRVTFTVTSGPAYVRLSAADSDAQGRAAAAVDSGPGSGPVTITADGGGYSTDFTLIVRPAPLPEDPVIGSVLHAARLAPPGGIGSELAPGAAFLIRGGNLAATDAVTITPVSGGEASSALVLRAAPNEITAVVPPSVAPGEVNITVGVQPAASIAARVMIVPSNFGIYTRNGAGYGPALTNAFDNSGAQWAATLTWPVRPGDRVALPGTGIGKAEITAVEIILGGKAVLPYAMGVGWGADEVDFEVPEGIAAGCYVPVAVRAGDVLSNFGTIPVADADSTDACLHPLHITAPVLADLDNKASVPGGILGIIRLGIETPLGSGYFLAQGGTFTNFDAGSLFASGGIATTTVTDGACTVRQMPLSNGLNELFPIPLAAGLDAGQVAFTSPGGRVYAVPRRSSGAYEQSGLLSYEEGSSETIQGKWTVTGGGGTDISAFETSMDVPAPVFWTNRDSAAVIDRANDLTVTWDTAGDNPPEHVIFTGAVIGYLPVSFLGVHTQFVCSAPFAAGTLTVPSLILSQLPPTGSNMTGLAALVNSPFDSRTRAFGARTVSGADLLVTVTSSVAGQGITALFR